MLLMVSGLCLPLARARHPAAAQTAAVAAAVLVALLASAT